MGYGREYLRQRPVSGQPRINGKQLRLLAGIITSKGITQKYIVNYIADRFMADKIGLLTENEAQMLIDYLKTCRVPRRDGSWIIKLLQQRKGGNV